MSVVKVYCKIETSPWTITLTEPVPEASDQPGKNFIDPTNCPWVSEDGAEYSYDVNINGLILLRAGSLVWGIGEEWGEGKLLQFDKTDSNGDN